MRKIITCTFILIAGYHLSAQTSVPPTAKALVSKMTLEEKVNLVVGMGMNIPGLGPDYAAPEPSLKDPKVPSAAGHTFAIPRLGIPSIVLSDGPAGVRIDSVRADKPGKTYYATAWPVATLLASTWDTAAIKKWAWLSAPKSMTLASISFWRRHSTSTATRLADEILSISRKTRSLQAT